MMGTLSDRYVHAVTRRLPAAQRADVARELRSSIDDVVEARAERVPAEQAELEAITELGDPERLAADYRGSTGFLIGPALYVDYVRLVRMLLAIVPPIVVVVALFGALIDGERSVYDAVEGVIGAAIMATIHVLFWTTLVFAIFERRDPGRAQASPLMPWSPDDLGGLDGRDDRSRSGRQISVGETLFSVALYVVMMTLVPLKWLNPTVSTVDGSRVPTFLPELWNGWIWYIVAVLAAMLTLDLVKLRVGHWTTTIAVVNVGTNLAFTVQVVWLLLSENLINPDAIDALGFHLEWDSPEQVLALGALVVVLNAMWDVVDGFWKARRLP